MRVKTSRLSLLALLTLICVTASPSAGTGFMVFAHPSPVRPTSNNTDHLARSVTIYRDTFGVPHVYGPTDASVVFGFVYAQAEDNFWQIEDNYIRSLGRATEVHGAKVLPETLLNRALEIPKLSMAEYQSASPRTRAICDAVANGLNYYLARNPQVKPRLLTHFEPWYLLALSRYAIYQLFVANQAGFRIEEMRGAVGEVAQVGQPEATDLEQPIGSNTWAISGVKSANGHAMLFINPHQPFFGPGQWYEGHLESKEGWSMSGATLLGFPFPVIGHNQNLGWSHTVNTPDISDLYAEKFEDQSKPLNYVYGNGTRSAVEWTEVIKVKTEKGYEEKSFKLRKTHHGPIVAVREGKPLALKLARLEEGGLVDEWYAMSKARTLVEFKSAVSRLAIPMFNIMYADRRGNIFYLYGGAIPRRSTEFDWSKPVDGSRPETEWQGFHRLETLPQLTNPPSGFLQNCNSTPFSTTSAGNPEKSAFPAYMVPEQDNARARISRRLLSSKEKFSFEDWTQAATDTTVIEADETIPQLVAEWEKLKTTDAARAEKLSDVISVLKAWNHVSTVDSPAMTVFTQTFEQMGRLRANGFKGPPSLPMRALEQVVEGLTKDFGTWRVAWGEVNRLQRAHTGGEEPFSDSRPSLAIPGGPGYLGLVYTFYTRRERGQKGRYGIAGNSFVSVIEFGPKIKANSVLVFGQSADPESPHYFDQAPLYSQRRFKQAWWTFDEVKANSSHFYHPGERWQELRKAA